MAEHRQEFVLRLRRRLRLFKQLLPFGMRPLHRVTSLHLGGDVDSHGHDPVHRARPVAHGLEVELDAVILHSFFPRLLEAHERLGTHVSRAGAIHLLQDAREFRALQFGKHFGVRLPFESRAARDLAEHGIRETEDHAGSNEYCRGHGRLHEQVVAFNFYVHASP